MYTYKAKLVRVIDGDSAWLQVDVGFRMTFTDNFRLLGIDTPELRTRDLEEKARAYEAKDELVRLLTDADITIETEKPGKYGRWLATIYVDVDGQEEPLNVNQHMLNEGFAKPY